MAYIEAVAKRRWRVRWRDESGKLRSSERFDTKGDAQEALEAAQTREDAQGEPGLVIGMAEAKERFLASLARKERRPRYLDEVRAVFRRRLTCERLSEFTLIAMEQCPTGDRRVMRAFLHYCQDDLGLSVDRRLLRAPERTKRKPAKELLEDDQVLALVRAAGDWSPANGALVHIIATYGHRAESLIELRVRDFRADPPALTMRVKSGDRDTIPILQLTGDLLEPLVKGRKPDDFLFLSHLGMPWRSGQDFAYWFRRSIGGGEIGYYRLKEWAITQWRFLVDDATGMSITLHRTRASFAGYERTSSTRQQQAIEARGNGKAPIPLP